MAQAETGDGSGNPLDAAWRALWAQGSPYFLPELLTHRVRARGLELAPLTELSVPPTGSIKLLRKAPWGIVAFELEALELTGLNLLEGLSFTWHPDSPVLSAELAFTGLQLAGTWRVDTGGPESPASRTVVDQVLRKRDALKSTAAPPGAASNQGPTQATQDRGQLVQSQQGAKKVVRKRKAIKSAAATLGAASNQGLTQATQYRGQLVQSPQGTKMVGAYYDNNDAFHEIMAMPLVSYNWTQHQTNGQTTAYYAQQTVNATAPGATQSVNGQPDSSGYSPYNAHGLYMGTIVMNMAYYLADNTYANNPAKQAQMNAAGDATSTFSTTTTPVSKKAMTANDVMNTVNSGQGGSSFVALGGRRHLTGARYSGVQDNITHLERDEDPQWVRDVYAGVRKAFTEWGDPTQHRPDLHSPGVEQSKRELLSGHLSFPFHRFAVTLTGQKPAPGSSSPPIFTDMRVRMPDPGLALGEGSSPLQAEVQRALDGADFLRSVLRHRIEAQLRNGGLLQHLNTTLQLALTGALGPLGR